METLEQIMDINQDNNVHEIKSMSQRSDIMSSETPVHRWLMAVIENNSP